MANREYNRAYYARHREEKLAYQRQYTKDHPRDGENLARRERWAGRPKPSVCEVCGRPPKPGKVLNWDHDHRCCRVGCAACFRGWICQSCNTALGMVDDDPQLLLRLAQYVVNYQFKVETIIKEEQT